MQCIFTPMRKISQARTSCLRSQETGGVEKCRKRTELSSNNTAKCKVVLAPATGLSFAFQARQLAQGSLCTKGTFPSFGDFHSTLLNLHHFTYVGAQCAKQEKVSVLHRQSHTFPVDKPLKIRLHKHLDRGICAAVGLL